MDAYVDDLFDPVFDQGPPVSIVQFKNINIIVQFLVILTINVVLFNSNWTGFLLIYNLKPIKLILVNYKWKVCLCCLSLK